MSVHRSQSAISDSFDAVEAFATRPPGAAAGSRRAACDLCLIFAGAPHLGHGKGILGRGPRRARAART